MSARGELMSVIECCNGLEIAEIPRQMRLSGLDTYMVRKVCSHFTTLRQGSRTFHHNRLPKHDDGSADAKNKNHNHRSQTLRIHLG